MNDVSKTPLIFQFFTEIGIIEQLSRSALERNIPHGLKISQFSLLNHFVRLGGIESPAQLASAFQVTKGAMTNTLQRLEALGFIDVIIDPKDKRAKQVSITKAGVQAHEDSIRALGPMLQEILENIPASDFEKALPFLTHVRKYLDEQRF